MKIHLGAGDKYWPGWVNVDLHGEQDVISNVLSLPFENDEADEIWAIHIFEHIARLKSETALNEWFRVLKPGGRLVLEMPSLDKIARLIVQGEENIRLTLLGLYGDPQDPKPDMMHQWGWGIKELDWILRRCGFFRVDFEEPRFHIAKRDMRAVAFKENTE